MRFWYISKFVFADKWHNVAERIFVFSHNNKIPQKNVEMINNLAHFSAAPTEKNYIDLELKTEHMPFAMYMCVF